MRTYTVRMTEVERDFIAANLLARAKSPLLYDYLDTRQALKELARKLRNAEPDGKEEE